MTGDPIEQMAGRHVLVLHPTAPESECDGLLATVERWAAAGAQISWLATGAGPAPLRSATEALSPGGVRVLNPVGVFGEHPTALARALATGPMVDAVLVSGSVEFPRALCWPRHLPVVRVVRDAAALPAPRHRHPGEMLVVPSPAERRAARVRGVTGPVVIAPGLVDPDRTIRQTAAAVVSAVESPHRTRRQVRPDLSTIARVRPGEAGLPLLRITDEVSPFGDDEAVLLHGCDEVDALMLLTRHGVTVLEIRLATDADLMRGPGFGKPAPARNAVTLAGG